MMLASMRFGPSERGRPPNLQNECPTERGRPEIYAVEHDEVRGAQPGRGISGRVGKRERQARASGASGRREHQAEPADCLSTASPDERSGT